MFAGLRPLVKGSSKKTAALSRDHLISVADSGLITITGGKWTTYRKMAEDVVDIAIEKNRLPKKPCITKELKLYGHDQPVMPAEIFTLNNRAIKSSNKKIGGTGNVYDHRRFSFEKNKKSFAGCQSSDRTCSGCCIADGG